MDEKKKIRKSIVCTFGNHAPIRFWGEFEENENADPASRQEWNYLDNYVSTLWDGRKEFGHHTVDYYICKSGKRIYFASYNSGQHYGNHAPRTTRTYLKDVAAIKDYFSQIDRIDEWYRVCGNVDPALIVDSDLL